jgi:hypothetical protein
MIGRTARRPGRLNAGAVANRSWPGRRRVGVLVVLGVLAWLGALSWFGRLPGDIRVERPGVRVYVPFASMLLVSLALTVVLAIIRRIW